MSIFWNLPSDNSKGTSRIILIIIILVIIFGIFSIFPFLKIPMMYLLTRTPENVSLPAFNTSAGKAIPGKTTADKIDSSLIGNWDTGCLIPDPKSNYAERHTFVINTNGTANHKRYMGSSCSTMNVDHDDDMTWKIAGTGKINLHYSITGGEIYDIYEVSGDALKFGHGFCNCSNGGSGGFSSEDRFTKLNDFLAYKRQ